MLAFLFSFVTAITAAFLRTGCQDRENSFAEVCFYGLAV